MRRRSDRPSPRSLLLSGLLVLALAGPLTAQVPAAEYAARRDALTTRLGDGLYLFAGAPPAEADYLPWDQGSDFLYLTGWEEPGGMLALIRRDGSTRSLIFTRGGSATSAIWEGEGRGGPTAGLELRDSRGLEDFLDEVATGGTARVIAPRGTAVADVAVARLGGPGAVEQADPTSVLSELRGLKSPAEIGLLVTAGTITASAQREAFRAVAPNRNEFEIQALIEYTFRRNGARRPGFASIVGSGPNSTVLHYNRNDRFMQPGEVLVMDVGASYEHYTADVTRTVPVSGIFTPEQRAVYEVVLAAHDAAEAVARRPGVSFREVSQIASQVLAEGCTRLGLIEAPDAVIPGSRRSQLSLFYMHGLGHGIGLEVHDSMPAELIPGTCFTIEPGLYIRPDALERIGEGPGAEQLRARLAPVVVRYADIGVRIEDCYAVTAEGLVCLSDGVPRTVAEVEAIMAEPSFTESSREAGLVEHYRIVQPPPH